MEVSQHNGGQWSGRDSTGTQGQSSVKILESHNVISVVLLLTSQLGENANRSVLRNNTSTFNTSLSSPVYDFVWHLAHSLPPRIMCSCSSTEIMPGSLQNSLTGQLCRLLLGVNMIMQVTEVSIEWAPEWDMRLAGTVDYQRLGQPSSLSIWSFCMIDHGDPQLLCEGEKVVIKVTFSMSWLY